MPKTSTLSCFTPYFQALVGAALLSITLGCTSEPQPNLVNKPGGGGGNSSKPEQEAASGELLAPAFFSLTWAEPLLRWGLGFDASDLDRCVRKEQSGDAAQLILERCAPRGAQLSGSMSLTVEKDAAGMVQKIKLMSDPTKKIFLKKDRRTYENQIQMDVQVELKRLTAFSFEFSESVNVDYLRNAPMGRDPGVRYLQGARRTGQIQLENQTTWMSFDLFEITTNMFLLSDLRPKYFESTIVLTPLEDQPNAFSTACGLPQGELAFENRANNNGKSLAVDGALVLDGSTMTDRTTNRRSDLRGLCHQWVTTRFGDLENLINSRVGGFFGKVRPITTEPARGR